MTAEQKVTRKLRAIMSADVKGYSILMVDDEVATVRTLKDYRNIMSARIEEHGGRVVDAVGDNLLAEFDSAVGAVECAVEVQKELKTKNQKLPPDKRLEFRIGVNIGDVIQDGDSIFGDGVNIAARIEKLADAGGVCISRNAYNHIKKKLSLGYEYLGEHPVKNISEPVTVYKVLMDEKDAGKLIGVEKKAPKKGWLWAAAVALVVAVVGFGIWQFYLRRPAIEPASEEKMAFPLPEKPSIAVLPFDNMSGDPGQDYFSDGITEEIISSLSKTDKLFVIARNSTFTYKGKPVRVKQVAEELGVRYVLEGSVRKSEDRVRITAQLIDATRGHHLWSERYDRELKDIFAVQDEITMKIVNALQIKLTEGEQARIWIRQSENLDVYLKSMEAASLFREGTKESIIRMGQLGQEIVDMAPESPIGYKTLAWYNWYLAHAGKSPEESITKAYKLVQKALALDESDAIAHALLGQIYTKMRQYDQAIAAGEKSVELDPNGALAHVNFGGTLCYAGRIDEGIDRFKQAIRLNPYPEYLYFVNFGRCYRQKGQYELALTEYKKAFQLSPDNFFVNMSLAAIYALLDRQEEAEAAAQKVLEINPNFTVERASKTWPYKNPADIKLFADALLKAGLPYTPPLPLPDKPSIAVLAFDNLSGDPEQEYFSDGIAENIITALSKVGELFVIARNSSFTYKGKPVKVQQVSRELGVRYVLEGSVQKSGDRVRITAQLIDATNGQHLWAENYDRELKDIFDIQDEITMKIVNALRVELTEGERARIYTKQFKSLDVYLKQAQATSLWNKGTREALIRYGQLTQEIIEAEPESPVGYRARAYYHNALAARGLSPS
jgi:adenylate cyclase